MSKDIRSKQHSSEWEVTCRNLKTSEVFTLPFNNEYSVRKFVRKCKFSKKVRILGVDNIHGYDFNYSEV